MAMRADGGGFRLRPLAIGDVLDGTFQIYRRQFISFITVMAVVVVPSTLLSLLAALAGVLSETALARDIPTAAGITAVLLIFLLAIVASLAAIVAGGAATLVASGAILGQPIGVWDAYREALQRLGSLLLSGLLVGLAIGLLIITCLGIPIAVYVAIGWGLIFPAIMLEGRGATDAMRRSWRLVDGHRWRLLICSILIGLIVAILVSIPSGLFAFASGIVMAISGGGVAAAIGVQIGNAFFQAVGQTLFGAITYILMTLLYYDLRVRKEAFDLEQRAGPAEPQAGDWQQPYPTAPYQPSAPPSSPEGQWSPTTPPPGGPWPPTQPPPPGDNWPPPNPRIPPPPS